MNLSADSEKNEVARVISRKFTIGRGRDAASVDDYVRRNDNGEYEVKVSGTTGQSWYSDKSYGSLSSLRNNPDYILRMRKVRGNWQGILTQRRYYGLSDVTENLIFRK